jgi:hypothetical protein
MNKPLLLLIVAFISGLCTSSCKKDSDSSSANLIEPGQLISITEASSISAENYMQTQTSEQTTVGLKLCDYKTSEYGLFQIGLTQTAAISESAGLTSAKDYYQSIKANFTDQEAIAGVGDEAFISNANGDLNILYADDYYISIYLAQSGIYTDPGRWTAAQKKAMKIAAGKKAIENLKALLAK